LPARGIPYGRQYGGSHSSARSARARLGATNKVNLGRGRRPADLTGLYFCTSYGIRWLTRAYNYRLGFFLDFTAQQNLRFLDQIDRNQLLRYVKFLREHDSDLDDRTVQNVFETLNTLLRTRDILIAGKILEEVDYAEKPPKPHTKQEIKAMFAVMNEEEKLLYGLFLNSGVRDAEMRKTEYADFNWEKCTLHVQPKPWRKFCLKARARRNPPRTDSFPFRQSWFGRSRTECESVMPNRIIWCPQWCRQTRRSLLA
jgi:integrase